MRIALFPGTFDPFTLGHHSIVKRTLAFMDEVIIGIGINENKRCLLPVEKRLEGIRKLYADEPRVKVLAYSGLTVDFAQEQGAGFIVRLPVQGALHVHGSDAVSRHFHGVQPQAHAILLLAPDHHAGHIGDGLQLFLHPGPGPAPQCIPFC
mgnify:CR=1 FL=1